MNENDLWQDFELSGSVNEYLRYKNSERLTAQNEKAGESHADSNERHRASRSKSRRGRPDINDSNP